MDWGVSKRHLKRNQNGVGNLSFIHSFIHSFMEQTCAEALLHRDTSLSEHNLFFKECIIY